MSSRHWRTLISLIFINEETLRLCFSSKEEIEKLDSVSDKHRLMLAEYFENSFAMGH